MHWLLFQLSGRRRRLTKVSRPACIGSVCGRAVWILTMMLSYASAAKLRAAGPFSRSASSARFEYGIPRPRIVNSAVVLKNPARAPNGAECHARSGKALSGRWTQDDALQWLASSDKAPERNDQFACQRDDHGLARATTAVGGAGAIPQC